MNNIYCNIYRNYCHNVMSRYYFQCHHMSLMDFEVPHFGCGRSVTDFWGLHAHEAQLRCPDEVDGDTWIWSTRRGLNLSSTKLPRPWSPWEPSTSRKYPHGRIRNRTRDLLISRQKLWPLDLEAGRMSRYKMLHYPKTIAGPSTKNSFLLLLHVKHKLLHCTYLSVAPLQPITHQQILVFIYDLPCVRSGWSLDRR
jgi:hypothetical protein